MPVSFTNFVARYGLLFCSIILVLTCNGCQADTSPPVITSILSSDITDTIAKITWITGNPTIVNYIPEQVVSVSWLTDEPSTSQVDYGQTETYGYSTALDNELVVDHTVLLDKVEAGTIFHYRVRSMDAKGNEIVSPDCTFGWCTVLVESIPKFSPCDKVSDGSGKLPPDYLRKVDSLALIKWIEQGFQYYPPSEGRKRDTLFMALDLAGTACLANREPFMREYIANTTRSVFNNLKTAPLSDFVIIYKLYNEGTIIKTHNVCIGVDIILDPTSDDLAPEFAQMLDALFITHNDIDHFDLTMKTEMENQAKPVIMAKHQDSAIPGNPIDSGVLEGMQWIAFEGSHLNMAFSGFFVFKFGDCTILHSGDNTRWINFVNSEYARNIDVFLIKPESVYGYTDKFGGMQEAIEETFNKMKPRFVIPHHLLEVYFHAWTAYSNDMGIRLYNQVPSDVKVQLLHWGESFIVPPK